MNNTDINVLDVTKLSFEIDGRPMQAEVVVSDNIDEFILGATWMKLHRCQWLFDVAKIVIDGSPVSLCSRGPRKNIRHVYTRETVCVPRDTAANVPVCLSYVNLHTPRTDWITESKEVRPGLLAARTLVSGDDKYAAIRLINLSEEDRTIRCKSSLGEATMCAPNNAIIREVSTSFTNPASIGTEPMTEGGPNSVNVGVDGVGTPEASSVEYPLDLSTHGSPVVYPDPGDHSQVVNPPLSDPPRAHVAAITRGTDPTKIPEHAKHVKPVIDKLPDCLTAAQKQQAIDLVCRNSDIFSNSEFDVGCTDLLTAEINTGDHRPIAEPLRRQARVHLDIIDETIGKMKATGIIEDACSPWSANLVVVAKKSENGKPVTPRITVDYRGLNSITYKDKFPLPNITDCLRTLDRAAFISTIDLSNSFFQVPLRSEADHDKTAFRTRRGQYRLTRLGQGCTNSPAVFCRLMTLVLKGLTCCLAYIDDTICFSKSFEDHLTDLETVLNRFRLARLKLKPTKCKFFQTRVRFVGHIVSAEGIEVDDEKVACIRNWSFPKTVTEMRSFLGMAGYYRSYCKGYATITDPLQACTRKNASLQPTPERLAAFNRLKDLLSSAPVLAVPRDDEECTYVLDTDASAVGASAVLQQLQDGKLRVIEYASRSFNKAEKNYCATRREMAALIYGLKQFRQYLLGRHFKIRVDNMALTFYRRMKDPQGQAARFLELLSNYTFDIEYRQTNRHTNADALSRLRPCELDGGEPCKQCNTRITGKHKLNVVKSRPKRTRGPPANLQDFAGVPTFSSLADQNMDTGDVDTDTYS